MWFFRLEGDPLVFWFARMTPKGPLFKKSCEKYSGFYLGSIGGPGAELARKNITEVKCIEYPELGMEAIWKITVKDFPAFLVIDNKGNDFYENLIT